MKPFSQTVISTAFHVEFFDKEGDTIAVEMRLANQIAIASNDAIERSNKEKSLV